MKQIWVNKGIEFPISATCSAEEAYKAVLLTKDGDVKIEAQGTSFSEGWQFVWSAEQTALLPSDVDLNLEILREDLTRIYVAENFAIARETSETLPKGGTQ